MTPVLPGPELTHSVVACPQCGADVSLPHDSDFVRCSSCGSTLVLVHGTLAHVLQERVGVTREQAGGILCAWLKRQAYVPACQPTVEELRTFPFLRVREQEDEQVTPLAPLPSPAVAHMANDPTELMESDDPVGQVGSEALEWAAESAAQNPAALAVQVEVRGYYAAEYTLMGEEARTYSAIIGAGQGTVHADVLPPRTLRRDGRLRGYLIGLAAILVAESVSIPSLGVAVGAVLATAALFGVIILATGVSRG